jgi:hypothetical protein
MTKYPALAIAVFAAAISIEANATGVKPPAPQQPINPGVVLNQPITLKPTTSLSNQSYSYSTSNAGSDSRTSIKDVGNSSASSSVHVEADKRRIPVATATAPALTASNGTCMGSSSAGAQGAAFGLSFGSTWTDTDCDRRYDSIRLQELGMTEAAMLLMCNKPEVREAMELAGTACPDLKQKPQEVKPEAVTWN